MSVDPNPRPTSSLFSEAQPPLFNELPAYKALAPAAILAPVFGLVSILSFAHFSFLWFSLFAVISGVYALRKIHRFPDLWMGEKFAKVGIGMGLLFALTALTISGTQNLFRYKAATDFSRQFAEVLQSGSMEEILYFQSTPEGREGKTPTQISDEIKKSAPNPQMFDAQMKPVRDLVILLKVPGYKITYDRLLNLGTLDLRIYAHPLFKITGPGTPEFPSKELYVVVRGRSKVASGDVKVWTVDELKFPFDPDKPAVDN